MAKPAPKGAKEAFNQRSMQEEYRRSVLEDHNGNNGKLSCWDSTVQFFVSLTVYGFVRLLKTDRTVESPRSDCYHETT